ncbi:MAG: DoxX family protein [Cyclobacteriaceae bacterium]
MTGNRDYSLLQRFATRFLLIYFLLYIIPYGFEYIYAIEVSQIPVWEEITIWFGETFLGWDFDVSRLNKGFDSKYDFTRFLLIGSFSLLMSACWLVVDHLRKRKYNNRLKIVLQTILRYHLAFTLILYGLAKVFPLQFGQAAIDRLMTPMGDFTPMSLLWAFMSYSRFYTAVTGWIEVLGGVLLLFRKTTFAGIFLSVVAMVNVVVIDIGYDVTVKMFAIHLLIMALILLSDHMKRVVDFLILNRSARPFFYDSLFGERKMPGLIVKVVVIGFFVVTTYWHTMDRLGNETTNEYSYFSSYHLVSDFTIDDEPLGEKEPNRWKDFSISGSSWQHNAMTVRLQNGRKKTFLFELDSSRHFIKLLEEKFQIETYELYYRELPGNVMVFEGTHLGDSVRIETVRKRIEDYRLRKNGTRWIRDL